MKTYAKTLVTFACLVTACGGAFAQDAMKKADPMMGKDANMTSMTMQECKDHMAMVKKDATVKKDEMMMKKDTMCAEMMKKDTMKK